MSGEQAGAETGKLIQVLLGLSPAKGVLLPVGEGLMLPLSPAGIFASSHLSLLILGAHAAPLIRHEEDPGPAWGVPGVFRPVGRQDRFTVIGSEAPALC